MRRADFLDRDGTLIADKDYLSKPEQVVFVPGAGKALKRLQDAGLDLFLLTNQSGVGRGYFTLDLAGCYVVGDKLIDLECGWNAGVRKSLLVRTGYGAEVERQQPPGLQQAVVVEDIGSAADWIIKDL